jgi:hypothetical protein
MKISLDNQRAFTIALIIFGLALTLSGLGSFAAKFFPIILCLFAIFEYRTKLKETFHKYSYLWITITTLITVSSIKTFFWSEIHFSFYQIIRSEIWVLFGLYLGLLCYNVFNNIDRKSLNHILDITKYFFYFLLFTCLVEFIFDVSIAPAYIRYFDSGLGFTRLYLLGSEIILPFMLLFYTEKKWTLFLLGIFFTLLTGGKSALLSIFSFIIYISINGQYRRNIYFKYFLFLFILFASLYCLLIWDRIFIFLNTGDSFRSAQISHYFNFISQSPFDFFIGAGLGPEYMDIMKALNAKEFLPNPDLSYVWKQVEIGNYLNYDIENGFIFFLYRLGFIGFLLYFFTVLREFGKYSNYIALTLCVIWLAGPNAGPSGALAMAFYGIAAGLFNKHSQ